MSSKLKSLPREKWTAIQFERIFNNKDYYVSQFGRVKSIDKTSGKEVLITGSKDKRGYLKFGTRTEKGIETKFIHKEVARAYVRQGKKERPYVMHKDFDKLNNNHRNLTWMNRLELEKYLIKKWDHFGYERKQGGRSKLTAAKVAMIKKYILKGKWTKTKIAEKYGVSITQIKRIERGENWANVEAKP